MVSSQALLETIDALHSHLGERDVQLLEREQELEKLRTHAKALESRNARLLNNVEVLRKLVFGPSSEKSRPTPEQAAPGAFLPFADLVAAGKRFAEEKGAEVTVEVKAHQRKRKGKGRRSKFPKDAPVVRTTYSLPEDARSCKTCSKTMTKMGEEVRKELERIEVTLVHETAIEKYSCRTCHDGVVTAPGPDRVIDKGILGAGFLAHVLTERFQHHMPYHRQEKKYASEGLSLSRSVLCESAGRCASLLEPIYEAMKREVVSRDIVHSDDTPVVLRDGPQGGRRQARMWIYRTLDGVNVFDFTEDRSAEGPLKFLTGFSGTLKADDYVGYQPLYRAGDVVFSACMAHARRYYTRAESTEPEFAREALERIRAIYAVEREAKATALEAKQTRPEADEAALEAKIALALRQEKAKPLLESFQDWLAVTRTQVLDQGPMARAIDYSLSNWEALILYLKDGRLPIDNNAAERSLRGVCVGRKNWNVIGSENGGRTAALLFSLVETCKEIGVHPREYFRDVLHRISTCSDVTKLTPHGWKEHFQAEVKAKRNQVLQLFYDST
jgi:transposase